MNGKTSAFSIDRARDYVRSRPLIWDTLVATVLSLAAKGAGFMIPFFIAAWFGVSPETDAFFFAYGLVFFLATIFSTVVESIIVPFIAEARAKKEDVGRFVGRVLGMSAAGLLCLSIVFLLTIRPLLARVSHFSPEGLELIFSILLESAPLAVLIVWTSVLSGAFNAYKLFAVPALSPLFRAVVTLWFIYALKDSLGVHAIALGYVAGELFRLTVLLVLLLRKRFFTIGISIGWDNKFSEFFRTSSYQVAGMSALAFTAMVNKTMVSWMGPGSVSLLEYAERLYMIPLTLLTSGFIVTLLSHWSARYQTGGEERLRKDVTKTVRTIGVTGVLLMAVLFISSGYLAAAVYGHGSFPQDKITEISRIFRFFLLGTVPYFLSQVYTRGLLTRKDSKSLLYAALLIVSTTVVLNLLLLRVMGVAGVALTSAVVSALTYFFMRFLFYRKGAA